MFIVTEYAALIASVEVSNMARCSGKANELRDIDSIGCRAKNITI